ncbi:unnamed protein product [Schistosoma margrebowiei]|uniref:Secreted protein n=1 Tax=Schistosoma margrebowiei TaxID=48269 RepID=A0A183MWB9_9TREM|nr:unnamed protein product [Schistosoma margrebowiei]VDP35295.1 unnamed protein product [Schistosoma margrebowiei]
MNFISISLLLFLSIASLSIMPMVITEFSNLYIPIEFNENNQMFLRLEQLKLVLDKDDQLTVKDGDCVTTVDLAAPNAKEIKANKAHRQVTRICTSWYSKNVAKKSNSTVKK